MSNKANNLFDFTYCKPDIKQLSEDLGGEQFLLDKVQLYSPINDVFLKLNNTNANSTALNYNLIAKSILSEEQTSTSNHTNENSKSESKRKSKNKNNNGNDNENNNEDEDDIQKIGSSVVFSCLDNSTANANDVNTATKHKICNGFIKYSPLLDPIRYLVGKYDLSDNSLKELPLFDNTNSHEKLRDVDNASYVDSFFSYLSSKMLHEHGFLNALDCYGSVLGHKKTYTMDIVDDIEYLMESNFFTQNNHILYDMDNEFHNQLLNHDSRSRKVALKIDVDEEQTIDDVEITERGCISDMQNNNTQIIDLCDVTDIDLDKLLENDLSIARDNDKITLVKRKNTETTITSYGAGSGAYSGSGSGSPSKSNTYGSSSSCSSRTSHTDDENENDNSNASDCESNDDVSNDDSSSYSDEDTCSTASEDRALVNIYDYPVNAIFLEKCENTLDYLCDFDEEFGNEELCAALMQVIMSLIAFHKCFDFQHNDLHTNNIMYVSTQKQFLYYRVNDTHYKVPTYGRIFKIIDFGRATYKFRGNQICSDSFHKDGDAHSQFNFGRSYNPAKPRIEPNNSFDLCRLGTSLIDFLIEDLDDIENTKDPVVMMVSEWCKDDKGRNMLWKSNGDERYPGFKLYKMISRTVSKHTPISQLNRPILEKYKCARKNIKKGTTVMNIDALPCYTEQF